MYVAYASECACMVSTRMCRCELYACQMKRAPASRCIDGCCSSNSAIAGAAAPKHREKPQRREARQHIRVCESCYFKKQLHKKSVCARNKQRNNFRPTPAAQNARVARPHYVPLHIAAVVAAAVVAAAGRSHRHRRRR